MKLFEIVSKKGTYAGVHFTPESVKDIEAYINDNNISNHTKIDELHVTLLYSRKHLPNYKAQGKINPPIKATFNGFDIWKTQPDKDGKTTNCLVMKLNCTELKKRHEQLMDEHNATFDYDEYTPHITLSYNIGDDKKAEDFPEFTKTLEIDHEYQEELNDSDWAKNNSEK